MFTVKRILRKGARGGEGLGGCRGARTSRAEADARVNVLGARDHVQHRLIRVHVLPDVSEEADRVAVRWGAFWVGG